MEDSDEKGERPWSGDQASSMTAHRTAPRGEESGTRYSRCRRSTEVVGTLHDPVQHCAHMTPRGVELTVKDDIDILADQGVVEPCLRFGSFSYRLAHLVDESSSIASASPSLGNQPVDSSGGSADLIDQCITLLSRKTHRDDEYAPGPFERDAIDLEISEASNRCHSSLDVWWLNQQLQSSSCIQTSYMA